MGGWVGWGEEKEAVGMRCWTVWMGWEDRREAGGLNELLHVVLRWVRLMDEWVGGRVGRTLVLWELKRL